MIDSRAGEGWRKAEDGKRDGGRDTKTAQKAPPAPGGPTATPLEPSAPSGDHAGDRQPLEAVTILLFV